MTKERIKRALTRRLGEGSGQHRAGSRAAETVVVVEEAHEHKSVQFLGLPLGFNDKLYGGES